MKSVSKVWPPLALAGPTAAGKTAAALAIAKVLPIEIISVDSALVYQNMDIGTAKPTLSERAAVPHHLIDIIDPSQAYSAAQFVAAAQELIQAIQARGRLPLLVGGTMLYFKALFEGLDDMPAADPDIRAQIEQEAQQQGWPALHGQLSQIDALTAQRLAPQDGQRIGRALEVWRLTGKPLSFFQSRLQPAFKPLAARSQAMPCISLEPQDRSWLHQRIASRFHSMLEGGLIDEVRRLRARGDLHANLPAMRCVGYRQVWEALDAAQSNNSAALSTQQHTLLLEKGLAATRQLAKRQITWLRSMPARQVIACDDPRMMELVVNAAQNHARA